MPSNICVRVGKRIRSLRLIRGWRQIDLAAHAKLEPTHVSRIETGKKEICLLTIEKIALALEVQPAELFK